MTKCLCIKESRRIHWQDGACWGCHNCDHVAYGDAPDKNKVKVYPADEQAPNEANMYFHFRMYFRNAKDYNGFNQYLGQHALARCEDCRDVIAYDEVNEDGICLECQADAEPCGICRKIIAECDCSKYGLR